VKKILGKGSLLVVKEFIYYHFKIKIWERGGTLPQAGSGQAATVA
jgi:hypothetical protein